MEESEIVKHLLRLRDALSQPEAHDQLTRESEAARDMVINIVNNFYYEKLVAMPSIKDYMDMIQAASK